MIAFANRTVSLSARDLEGRTTGGGAVEVPQTAHSGWPAPTMAPQLRQSVGLPLLLGLEFESDKLLRLTSVMLCMQSITPIFPCRRS